MHKDSGLFSMLEISENVDLSRDTLKLPLSMVTMSATSAKTFQTVAKSRVGGSHNPQDSTDSTCCRLERLICRRRWCIAVNAGQGAAFHQMPEGGGSSVAKYRQAHL